MEPKKEDLVTLPILECELQWCHGSWSSWNSKLVACEEGQEEVDRVGNDLKLSQFEGC